ncbi:methenyltetrahydrofolate cyclohydrolase [Micrococcus flavus]|uniref:Formiminotetrahydrofolate cyclodeaminase n=1 Tax=Micrococcus flavus TaxID=384602 RepID=A0A4Y8X439_9MICC|nr:cyclodeaminase/cyclohydrolase family protein [Micrococcus flavus]MBB4882656.1 formiminotetrahydrofolate cyclodeaminase [Micrococcus flavus]TFI04125.1 methenyltetrahydrofolate cyclohydrolase [Micrococcus flavus]GGK39164.1 methenyltetrahydrofolate cyclohydrolase [Micrococcus flavus]
MIRHESIEGYLQRLASGDPTPGGGATGALAVAEGAGLVSMAARYSDRDDVSRRCGDLIRVCLAVADEDERGFGAVAEAFGLSRGSDQERADRSAAIQEALAEAVRPPVAIVDAVERLLREAEEVLEDGNPNTLSDVGTALGCARAGLTAAVVTLETNLAPLKDDERSADLRERIGRAEELAGRVDALVGRVRELITG